jgi:murein DD-endopeptidase MepM/ murein hydrolase activator NlpD
MQLPVQPAERQPTTTTVRDSAPPPAAPPSPAPAESHAPGRLAMPIAGIDPAKLHSNFDEVRGHKHEALDIMSPRGTPVMAVAEGNVVKLFTSKEGGLTVYQFDDSQTLCYYYAHLDRYAPRLKEGTLLRPGEVLGYVGSTGDASLEAPHLHFAVFRLGPEKQWWKGTAIDPLPLLQ